jgi:hypothetical protein
VALVSGTIAFIQGAHTVLSSAVLVQERARYHKKSHLVWNRFELYNKVDRSQSL